MNKEFDQLREKKNCRKIPRSHHLDVRIFGLSIRWTQLLERRAWQAGVRPFLAILDVVPKVRDSRNLEQKASPLVATHPNHCDG